MQRREAAENISEVHRKSMTHVALQWWMKLGVVLALFAFGTASQCEADSALPLLSGFDAQRIETAYPPTNEDSLGELAKLLYRLRKVSPSTLEEKQDPPEPAINVGDVTEVSGVIEESKLVAVPQRLVEFLDFSRLQILRVVQADGNTAVVVSLPLPNDAKAGDEVRGLGVAIETNSNGKNGRADAIACGRLSWFPARASSTGWQLLRQSGVDISLLSGLSSRSRRPLLAEDGDAFYSMLAAAAKMQHETNLPKPQTIEPVTLLKGSSELAGQWVRMDLETVQVTRIAVTDPKRQAELGRDHYFQIDAVGDLGNVVVRIERADGDDGPPATFNNRYPVSLVARELPEFLESRIREQEGGDAVVSQIRIQVQVDGFFFRLWSYSTDFMNQHGGGEQFGPLLVAAQFRDREPQESDPAGVGTIGTIAAIAVIAGILAIWIWQRRIDSRDREVRRHRKERESEQLQMP